MIPTIRLITCLCIALLLSACASSGELQEAKESQQNLSSQLAAAQKERDDWKARYDQLAVQSDAQKTQGADVNKKLADRDAAFTTQKTELDATTAKLGETSAQLAQVQSQLATAQRDQATLKQTQQQLADAEKAQAAAEQQVTALKGQLAAQNASAHITPSESTTTPPAAAPPAAPPPAAVPPPPAPAPSR